MSRGHNSRQWDGSERGQWSQREQDRWVRETSRRVPFHRFFSAMTETFYDVLANMVSISHIWALNTLHVANATMELNLNF